MFGLFWGGLVTGFSSLETVWCRGEAEGVGRHLMRH